MAGPASVITSLLTRLLIRRNYWFTIRSISSDTDKPIPSGFKLIRHTVVSGVHSILLSSPKTRNALSLEMLTELSSAFYSINETKEARSVLLSAEGNVFSAGHNLKELTKEKPKSHHELVFSTCTSLMNLLLHCPVPIVAKVDGVAAAAGCQMVAMCDIVLASSRSSFSTPGVSLGLFCSTPGVAVARSVPMKTASYMLYTGLPITADEALTAGLVSKVFPAEQLDVETERVIQSLREKSLPVMRIGKRFLQHQIKLDDVMEAYRKGERVMVGNLTLSDAQEGLASFAEKRKPKFSDQ